MRFGFVGGHVVCSRLHKALAGLRLVWALPAALSKATTLESTRAGEPIVLVDELKAGRGALIGMSEGREAAMPFHPEPKPIDAYCAVLVDKVWIDGGVAHD